MQAAGLREQMDGLRSMIQNRGWVVLSESLVEKFPGLRTLVGLEQDALIDSDDTIVTLIEGGAETVHYFGGLEEANRFSAKARIARIGTIPHYPGEEAFRQLLYEIEVNLGVPEKAAAAGLEGFAEQLEAVELSL